MLTGDRLPESGQIWANPEGFWQLTATNRVRPRSGYDGARAG